MINHVRTLLLNVNGTQAQAAAFPGEEFVPIDYSAVNLPTELQAVRNILFGINPDRVMLNYRLRQFATVLHTTELVKYVTDLDSRITYWPLKDKLLFDRNTYGATAVQLNTPRKTFYFVGNTRGLVSSSQLLRQWLVTITDGSQLTVQTLTHPTGAEIQNYTISNALSSLQSLPGTGLQFRFDEGVGSKWLIQTYARPDKNLSELITELQGSSPILDETLFLKIEPYKTFEAMWADINMPFMFRLGAVLLGLAYRTHDLITGS